ncbi:PD40 domain-containing protein [Streptomyces albiaxialis]|uniref:PD40 domain-containing protein n=2 Tax=Streptomyces albiaxialis TaxID=329523 RepID=A0ABN2VF27_9ACTN
MVLAAAFAAPALPATAAPGGEPGGAPGEVPRTEWVSVSPEGAGGNGHSTDPAISDDGRVLAFESQATNLLPGGAPPGNVHYRTSPDGPLRRVTVPGETTSSPALSGNGRHLSFGSYSTETARSSLHLMDLRTGRTERLDPDLPGTWTASYGTAPLSADGRYLAFAARPAAQPQGTCRIYVLDRRTGRSQRVSRPEGEARNTLRCEQMSMSADGRKIAYQEGYTGPADDDRSDILVHDRTTGRTVQADVTRDGSPVADRSAVGPAISDDGSAVLFNSMAENLVDEEDTNGWWNVFVRDLSSGETRRLDGHEPTDTVVSDDLTADGSKVLLNMATTPGLSPKGLYLHDVRTGEETLLSPGADGKGVGVGTALISGDGATVAFSSYYPGLVPEDTNLIGDVFVRPVA